MSECKRYIWAQLSPNKIEEGDFWVSDGWVYVEARRGKFGRARRTLEEGEDARRVAHRILRELVHEQAAPFWEYEVNPPTKRTIV